jgi:Ubiquitin-activating enzyme E1 FCCH domain
MRPKCACRSVKHLDLVATVVHLASLSIVHNTRAQGTNKVRARAFQYHASQTSPRIRAGEPPQTGIIASVTQGETTLVYCVEEDRLGFCEGDLVAFSEVVGMPELAQKGPFRVKAVKPYMIEIEVDSTRFVPHETGAFLLRVEFGTLPLLRDALCGCGAWFLRASFCARRAHSQCERAQRATAPSQDTSAAVARRRRLLAAARRARDHLATHDTHTNLANNQMTKSNTYVTRAQAES